MARRISRLIHQAHLTRGQVSKAVHMGYIGEYRKWLVARNWEVVDFKMEEAIVIVMDCWHKIKPNYPERQLIRTVDLFCRQNDNDPSTKMEHQIDKMSEKVIIKYIEHGHLVGINADERHHLQKYARKHQYFEQKGDVVNCPICNQLDSRGSRWIAANNIKVVSMSKRPGSRGASNEEQ